MSNNFWKGVGYVVLGIIGIKLAIWVFGLLLGLLQILIPIAIIGGIGYLIYRMATKDKSLPGSGTPLP